MLSRVEGWIKAHYTGLMIGFMVLEGAAMVYLCVIETLAYWGRR